MPEDRRRGGLSRPGTASRCTGAAPEEGHCRPALAARGGRGVEENEGGCRAVPCAVAGERIQKQKGGEEKQKPAYIFLSLDSDEKLEMQRSSWRITREV